MFCSLGSAERSSQRINWSVDSSDVTVLAFGDPVACKTGPEIVADRLDILIAKRGHLESRNHRRHHNKGFDKLFAINFRAPSVLWASSFRSCRRGAASFASCRPRRGPLSARSRVCSSHGRRGLSSRAREAPNSIIEREPAGAPSHDAERHRCPGYVNGPALGNGQFNDARHEQKSRRCKPRGKARN